MAKFSKGNVPWNKGLKGWNSGKDNPFFGKKHSKKSKVKIHKSLIKTYSNPLNHPRWKGGKRITDQGYIEIKSPNHPFKNKQGYVPEHRLVVEKYLGRYLTKSEIIHHINENPADNRIKNLYLFSKRWKHGVYHRFLNAGKIKPITKSNIINR